MADGESKTSYEAVHPSGEPNVLTKTIEGLTIDEPSQDELTENPPVADTDALSSRISGQEEDEEEQRVFHDDTSSVSTFPEMDDKAGKSDVFTKTSEEKVLTTDEASRDEPFEHSLVADEDAPSSRVSGPEDDGDEDLRVFQDDAGSVSTFPEMDDKAGKSEVLTETTEAKVPTTDVTSRDEPVEHPLVDDKDAASSRVSNPEEDEEIDDKAGKPDVFMKTNEENVLTADELSFPLVTASDAQMSRVSDPEKDGEEVRRFQDNAISPSRIPEIEDKAGEPNVFMKTTEEKTTADEPSRNEPFDRDGPSSRVSGPEKDGEDLIQIDTSSSPRVSGPEKDGKDLSQIDTSSSPRVSGPEKNAEDLIQIDTSSSPRVSGPEKDGEGLIKLDLSSSPRVCGSEKNGDQSSSPRVSGQKDGEHITQIEHSSSSSPEMADKTGQKIITEADVHYSSEGAPAKKPRMEPDFQRAGPSKPKGKSKLFTKTNKRKLSNTDESPREESAERDAPSSRLRGPEMPDEDLIQVVASSSSSSPDTVDKTESRLETVSPTVKQWCNFKKDNADAVIFFKKGDFYELLHMDALLAVKFLNLPLIEGDVTRCHFPTRDYESMARTLLQSGHKIVRVEEIETAEMMISRCAEISNPAESDKVIQREVCQITTMATCVFNAHMPDPFCFLPNYIYAICMTDKLGLFVFGVCFIETSMRKVTLAQFEDDANFTKLLNLLTMYPPDLVLLERDEDIGSLIGTLTGHFKNVPVESLSPYTEFLSATDTLVILSRACYFRDSDGNLQWPEIFAKIADNRIPKSDAEYAIKSLGACVWYLQKSKIDINVFTCATFSWYEPVDTVEDKNGGHEFMILDFSTITSLKLIGDNEESLYNTLDRCKTAFGKRELQMWILKPLCDVNKIKKRQEAILELHRNEDLLNNARMILNRIPDLERLLPKIYDYGNKFVATLHPDSRAILNGDELSKVKTRDFLRALTAFANANELINIFAGCEDSILKDITQVAPHGSYPDLMPLLESFYATFDLVKTEKYGKIIPKTGVNEEFDVLETRLKELLKDSTDYINEMSVVLGCTVEYYETDMHPILLKVPEEHCHILTDDYDLICIIPGDQPARLYLTPFTKTLSEDVLRTEGKMDDMLLNLNSSWFREFSEKKQLFEAAIQSLATLDVLCSLADYARTCTNDLCIPDVRAFEGKAILAITNSYQPCGENIENFVPNDIKLGVEDKGRLKIIIGPELSGKSTLLRQVGVTSILAHIGSLVPASCCVLTVMDRVCCRVGVYNESIKTLYPFVGEMGDICSVLTRSTERSLLLIDEIGKGSLPKDFVGIANVFIMKLLHSMCRVIVSTHCHAVALAHVENRNVGVANMDCVMALDENGIEQVTSFLYKLQELEM